MGDDDKLTSSSHGQLGSHSHRAALIDSTIGNHGYNVIKVHKHERPSVHKMTQKRPLKYDVIKDARSPDMISVEGNHIPNLVLQSYSVVRLLQRSLGNLR